MRSFQSGVLFSCESLGNRDFVADVLSGSLEITRSGELIKDGQLVAKKLQLPAVLELLEAAMDKMVRKNEVESAKKIEAFVKQADEFLGVKFDEN